MATQPNSNYQPKSSPRSHPSLSPCSCSFVVLFLFRCHGVVPWLSLGCYPERKKRSWLGLFFSFFVFLFDQEQRQQGIAHAYPRRQQKMEDESVSDMLFIAQPTGTVTMGQWDRGGGRGVTMISRSSSFSGSHLCSFFPFLSNILMGAHDVILLFYFFD